MTQKHPTTSAEFQQAYKTYEDAFLQQACVDFDTQPSVNRVQFLRGVFRYLLINRLLATHGHTLQTVLQNRYIDHVRGTEFIAKFVVFCLSRILHKFDGADPIIAEVKSVMHDRFPQQKVKGGQYVDSALDGLDIISDRKFGLKNISRGAILVFMKQNGVEPYSSSEAQKRMADKMSLIKKRPLN